MHKCVEDPYSNIQGSVTPRAMRCCCFNPRTLSTKHSPSCHVGCSWFAEPPAIFTLSLRESVPWTDQTERLSGGNHQRDLTGVGSFFNFKSPKCWTRVYCGDFRVGPNNLFQRQAFQFSSLKQKGTFNTNMYIRQMFEWKS